MATIDSSFTDAPPGDIVSACPKPAAAVVVPAGCEFLNKPYTVEAPIADFDRIRKPAVVGAGKSTPHIFPGDAAARAAKTYEVAVDGRKIPVVMPDPVPAGTNLPSAEQVGRALGSVPGKQLDSIKEIVVSPNQNPSDAYWATQYNIPGFASAATGGPSGVTFYPKASAWDQAFVGSTAIHEGGHAFSIALWKDPKVKTAWEDAIAADKKPPSTYAESSTGEDFSESLVMYSLSKGTKCEAPARKLYPQRYKTLDEMFK